MSILRPTLRDAHPGQRSPDGFDALYMIRDSVERRDGLIGGKLQGPSGVCAIGAFFADNPNAALSDSIIDEVAAYNDSIPRTVTLRERRNRVLRWLTARIDYLRGKTCAS
jgi:hypothetical protein